MELVPSTTLEEIGYPHYVLYKDGRLLNLFTGELRVPQKGNEYCLWDIDHKERRRVNSKHLLSWMFESPFATRGGDWANMAPLGYSRYDITMFGEVYSRVTYTYMVGAPSFDGYPRVYIVGDDGRGRTEIVHRLVAKMFIPNPDNKPEVNHIDGDKTNNHVTNLEWVTGWENVAHALHNNLRVSAVDDETIIKICEMLQDGYRVIDVMHTLDVPKHIVLGIKSGCHDRIAKNYKFPRNKHFHRAHKQ